MPSALGEPECPWSLSWERLEALSSPGPIELKAGVEGEDPSVALLLGERRGDPGLLLRTLRTGAHPLGSLLHLPTLSQIDFWLRIGEPAITRVRFRPASRLPIFVEALCVSTARRLPQLIRPHPQEHARH